MSASQLPDWLDDPAVRRVIFHPRPEPPSRGRGSFESLDIPVGETVTIGARLYTAGPDRPTLLFFHGNGEIVADYDPLAGMYVSLGANFFPVDYRGYGRSTGQPTLRNLLSDARAVFQYARKTLSERQYTGPVVVMGRSLGSASALELAAAYPEEIAGLIIDSGFADLVALVERLGARPPDAPHKIIRMRQAEKIATFSGPTLILHGTRDRIIPVGDAEVLFQASRAEEKRLVKIPGAGHNNLLAVDPKTYLNAVGELIRRTGERSGG